MHKPSQELGDPIPVTGGIPLPEALFPVLPAHELVPTGELDRQIYWLLKSNAGEVLAKFRVIDYGNLNDEAKRKLIAEIQLALGIMPFKKAAL